MGAHLGKCKPDGKENTYRLIIKGHCGYEDKTKFFETIKLKKGGEELPHYGFKMVKISVGGVHVECWDFGDVENLPRVGRCPIRFWYHLLFMRTDGIMYVIDSTASEKLDESLEEIEKDLLRDWTDDHGEQLTTDKVIMVLANKQDAEGALPLEKIEEKAKEIITRDSEALEERCLFVAGCNEDQEGLKEVMTLFKDQIRLRRVGKMKTGFTKLSTLQKKKRKEIEGDSKDPSKMHFLKKVANILSH